MEALTSFASVPAIMAICYFISEFYKWSISDEEGQITNKKAINFIPILCGFSGMILGILTYYQNPGVIHSENVLTAAVNGLSSGLSSVAIQKIKK